MTGQWLYWGSAIVVALGGTVLLAWALFSDRPRGRKRCPKCWYAMNDAPSLRCPECGHEVNCEKKLYKTRRRWKWVLASLVPFALAGYLAVQPKVPEYGWASIMPVTLLLFIFQFNNSDGVVDGIQYHATTEYILPEFAHPFRVTAPDALRRWQWEWLGRMTLSRLSDENRLSRRTDRYHRWLAVSRDVSRNEELRYSITQAFTDDLQHNDANVRWSATIFGIDYTDIVGSIERAGSLMEHENANTRHAAVLSLQLIARKNLEAAPPLLDALEHDDAQVRAAAIAALGSATDVHGFLPSAYDAVMAMQDDPSGAVRYWRIRTLARMQDEDDAWQTMQQAMQSDDLHTRRGGFGTATMYAPRPDSITPFIIHGLDDDDDQIRNDAVFLLQQHDAAMLAAHADQLAALRQHNDEQVRHAVASTLARIDSK